MTSIDTITSSQAICNTQDDCLGFSISGRWCSNNLLARLDKHESVHGSNYTSTDFRALLQTMGMKQSMGSIGDSYDNVLA